MNTIVEIWHKDGTKEIAESKMTEEEEKNWKEYCEWMKEVSCKCEEDNGVYYVPDGQDEECDKHHWRCKKCHKIVQIG